MKTPRFGIGLLSAILALMNASTLRAQVIYDNVGVSTFQRLAALGIFGNSGAEVAVQFTAGNSLFLDYADIELWNGIGPFVNVALLANGSGDTPGAVLETSTAPILVQTALFMPLTRAEFSNTLLLTAGTKYWLAVSPPNATTVAAWEYAPNPSGLVAIDVGQIGFSDPYGAPFSHEEPGMRIFGASGPSAVPEPTTYGLIASMLLTGVIAIRRRTSR